MLNYFLRLRRRKGFTLVELIIVIAILAVLMACMTALSGPIRKMVSRTSASADAIAANVTMANYIENRLGFAANIEVLCAINATDASGTSVNTAFNNMKTKLTASADPQDKAGVLIFRYVEDTTLVSDSHYEMFDVPITTTSTSYFDAAIASVGGANEIKPSTAVFDECFYEYSRNLFIAPTEITTNKVRGNYYMSFEIIPYNFDDDMLVHDASGAIDTTVNQYLSPTTIPSYYNYKYNQDAEKASGGDPATFIWTDETCGLSALDLFRSGTKETSTFELQNIMAPTAAEDPAVLTNRFKVTNGGSAGIAHAGTDILIFYYIPHY